MTGIETLARWPRGPSFLRGAGAFVCGEETALAQRLTRRMIENVADDLGAWLARHPTISVAINISAQDLEGDGLQDALERYPHSRSGWRGQIVLEITERSLLGVHAPIERLVERGYMRPRRRFRRRLQQPRLPP